MNLTCFIFDHNWDHINEKLKICRRCSEVRLEHNERISLDERSVTTHDEWRYKPKQKRG